ncbi:MAG: DUF4013 domain-containing protein, partial [Litoreibacter sp.]|nr:DUF4013 domain-containing protein [Litoreibacter sp.]
SLFIATAPFTIPWLLSWWAGWENSFSKGYEQAFVGPLLGLCGVVLFCVIMVWLPMALAHQAVENRFLAIFDFARVRSAVRHSGWGYLFLAIVTVVAGLPYFASRGLVTFMGTAIEPLTADQLEALRLAILIATSAYIVIALIILRGWVARIYATAVARALEGPDASIWASSPLHAGRRGGNRSWALTHWLRVVVLALIWFGLVAQIFVAQFLNHDWHLWLNHPLVALPWIR